jgi:hypothetical protein
LLSRIANVWGHLQISLLALLQLMDMLMHLPLTGLMLWGLEVQAWVWPPLP